MKKIILAAIMFLLWSDRALPDHFREANRRRFYHSLRQPRLSDSSYAVNDSIRIQLPDLVIHLIRGQLVPLHDSANGLTGLLFDGKARVRFSPRHEVERQQLHYFTQDSMLTRDVSHLLLRFTKIPAGAWSNNPSTSLNAARELLPFWTRLQRAAIKVRAEAAALPGFVQKEWLQRRGFNLAAHLLGSKYADASKQFVLCAFVPDEPPPEFPPLYLYLYNSSEHEAIQFFQYHEKALKRPFYTICSYPRGDYFAAPAPDTIRLTKYNGWIEAHPDGRLTADMGVDIFTGRRELSSLFFCARCRSCRCARYRGKRRHARFYSGKKESGLTVFLPAAPVDTLRPERRAGLLSGNLSQRRIHGAFAALVVARSRYRQRRKILGVSCRFCADLSGR